MDTFWISWNGVKVHRYVVDSTAIFEEGCNRSASLTAIIYLEYVTNDTRTKRRLVIETSV